MSSIKLLIVKEEKGLKEKQFWNRILEFAQERLTRSMYDFYAIQAELIKVEENIATIFYHDLKWKWSGKTTKRYYCSCWI